MDIQTFTAQVTPLRNKLYSFAVKILGDGAEAEDNVQETFLRMWEMRQKLTDCKNIGGLAMQINKNLCIDKLRIRKNKTTVDILNYQTNGQTAHVTLEAKQAIDLVGQIISTLPTLQQLVIRMRDVEGYEVDEIAALTASRPETVRVNLSRARQRVREQYFKLINTES